MNNGEYINYEQVNNGADEISQTAKQINDIFGEVSGSINTMTNEENFKGTASNALQAEFAPFKNEFSNYVNAVQRFAALYSNAAKELLENERNIEQQANALRGNTNINETK